jgi:glutamate:GABA antiporter
LGIFPALYLLRRLRPAAHRPYRVPGGDLGALVVSGLTFGWALFATIGLVWPGFGRRGDADVGLPAGFVVLDANGAVVSSQRLLFELTQLVPLALFLGVGLLFLALGRRATVRTYPVRAPWHAPAPRLSHPPSLRPAG